MLNILLWITCFVGLVALLWSVVLLIIAQKARNGNSENPFLQRLQRMNKPSEQLDFDFVFDAIAELPRKASDFLSFLEDIPDALQARFHKRHTSEKRL